MKIPEIPVDDFPLTSTASLR